VIIGQDHHTFSLKTVKSDQKYYGHSSSEKCNARRNKYHKVLSYKFDNNVTILQALFDTGRYPATLYPFWLRMIVTFLVPVAVATTVPLQALRSELSPAQIALFLGISAAAFLVAERV
jgi:hypothetical protein